MDSEDPTTARKIQKAGREKLRRDRLNEQFIELGNTLDVDRPKNDKATILTDTIQLLRDLTAEVNKLKAEHAALSDESHELTQEKNDLKEEKGALKSEVEKLNAQCQQRLGSTFPWVAVDHSVLQHPPAYSYPVPFPIPSAAIHMHPSSQLYPFFGSPNAGIYPNPCSTFFPYMTPNAPAGPQFSQLVSCSLQPAGKSQVSGRHDPGSLSEQGREKQIDRNKDSNDVATDLELKTPGSTTDEDASSREKKSRKSVDKKSIAAELSSSRCSSSPSIQESSSSSIVGGGKADDR